MPLDSPASRLGLRVMRAVPALLLGSLLGALLWRFAYPRMIFLSFFTDDFFYYLVVARNLAYHGVSTFNGITPTNGYHPLWLLTITLLVRLLGDQRLFFFVLLVLVWLLVCGAFHFLRRIQQARGTASGLGVACVLFSTAFMASISRTGMEISLALFFLTLLWSRLATRPLELQTMGTAVVSGLIASAAILGRLDVALIVAVYLLLTVLPPAAGGSTRLRSLAGFGVGLLPVAIYIATNLMLFHTLLPVSGMVKNLKPHHGFSLSTLASLAQPRAVQMLFVWPSLGIATLFMAQSIRSGKTLKSLAAVPADRVQLCVLLHPILFYTLLSLTSDWPLWTWYFYPLVPIAALLGPDALSRWPIFKRPVNVARLTAATAFFTIIVTLGMARPNPITGHMNHLAGELQDFALTHPGRYAMGDASGTPAYLIPQPFLQLEGLMGDRSFIERIRNRQPLSGVLSDFAIDYYVTNSATPDGGCYKVIEPNKAGPSSPTLAGRLCQVPIAHFEEPTLHDVLVFNTHELHARASSDTVHAR